ncbi:MAG TPA: hypothetical protein VII75_04640 [Thermoanaerobaculia bacterium]|nr:hypothetical protein [Thermoanaerobaculia bacterium]
MTTAIVIITFVVFFGKIAQSAARIRNWPLAATLAIVAALLYVAPFLMLRVSADEPFRRMYSSVGAPFAAILAAAMFFIGYGAPAVLTHAEKIGGLQFRIAFAFAVFMALLAVHLWSTVSRLGIYSPYIVPELWFAIGTAWFLVFSARIFEDDNDGPPADLRRMRR